MLPISSPHTSGSLAIFAAIRAAQAQLNVLTTGQNDCCGLGGKRRCVAANGTINDA
jgi:hypothetical protein